MVYEIARVNVDGTKCTLYLSCDEFPNMEMGIFPWDMDLRGVVMEKLAKKIAEEFKVSFKKENFGGYSGGNPPKYREVFIMKIGKEGAKWVEYLNPTKRKIKKELKNAKEKLIKTVRKLNRIIDKAVERSLRT